MSRTIWYKFWNKFWNKNRSPENGGADTQYAELVVDDGDDPRFLGAVGVVTHYDRGNDGEWPLIVVEFPAPYGASAFEDDQLERCWC